MTTTPSEVRTRPDLASAGEQWAGPSFLWSTVRQGARRLLAGGWRYRCTAWEQRFDDAGLTEIGVATTTWGWPAHELAPDSAGHSPGSGGDAAADLAGSAGCTELDVIVEPVDGSDDYLAMPGLRAALHTVLGAEAAAELMNLPPPGTTSITRNRPLLPRSGAGLRVADIRFSTLPYGHGDWDRPVQYASRWLRLATTGNAVVCLWGELLGHWEPRHVRWPHHAVPSRRVASLRQSLSPAGVPERVAAVLADCLEHEQYYLDTWQMELENWEAKVYSSLAAGDAVLVGIDLSDLVRERAGRLATFLSHTQFDLRALARRAHVEDLFQDELIQVILRDGLDRARALQADSQRLRREAFSLLTAVAAGEQLQASREQAEATHAQRQATESLQETITWVTALLLAPTVVIGVFGANIAGLAPGATATFLQLGQWMLVAAGLSMTALFWRNPPKRHRTWPWAAGAALATAAVVGTAALIADNRGGTAGLWAASSGAWILALVSAQLADALKTSRARRTRTHAKTRPVRETTAWT
jgi:Mg2+ and Co2+ transporter CorA